MMNNYEFTLPKLKVNLSFIETREQLLELFKSINQELAIRKAKGYKLKIQGDGRMSTFHDMNQMIIQPNKNLIKEIRINNYLLNLHTIVDLLFNMDLHHLILQNISVISIGILLYALSYNREEVKDLYLTHANAMKEIIIQEIFPQRISKLKRLTIKEKGLNHHFNDMFIALSINVIKTNPFLVEFNLPEDIKDDVSVLDVMNRSFTILKTTSYMNNEILNKNNKLFKTTKQLAITFLALRNKSVFLRKLDKGLAKEIAMLIFALRRDKDHLTSLSFNQK